MSRGSFLKATGAAGVAAAGSGGLLAVGASPAGAESCANMGRIQVPGAEVQETACLEDLTTAGTEDSGHTNRSDWEGLHAEGTENPTGVPGVQVDGHFPDDSSTNTNNGYNSDSQFVIRLPDEWNGKLVVTGAPGVRQQYANDFIIGDWVLSKGYAFASTDKGNTGVRFYATGQSPGDSVAEWHERVEELTRAAKVVVEQCYGREPERTYITGISNGGYLTRYALENTPELYDGGVDWEGTLFRAEGPNLLTYLPVTLRNYPSYRLTDDREAFDNIVEAGFPAESEFFWDEHYTIYWDLTQRIYREEFDPDYDGPLEAGVPFCQPGTPSCDADYDYDERPQEVRDAVRRVELTGDLGKPMITLHGTLDALLPISKNADAYEELVESAGRSDLHSYFVIEDGNHVDSFYDDYPDELRPILPCYRAAFEALEDSVENDRPLPEGGFVPRPEGGDIVNECSLEPERRRGRRSAERGRPGEAPRRERLGS
ncbi:MAG: tannase/feruloyl esterase family alpha/beta hydrolase [Rubrobacter sp.]|nr:tannase/feruloyl esterase family alpha/beta hydrolase [Rubrobacter sp.]